MTLTQFSVAAWFLFDIDIPDEEGTNEYDEVLEKITQEIESSQVQFVFKSNEYLSDEINVDWTYPREDIEEDA